MDLQRHRDRLRARATLRLPCLDRTIQRGGLGLRIEPTENGCLVSEVWQDRRGALVTWLSPFITGTKDRARRNEETMTVTIDRLAASAQSL